MTYMAGKRETLTAIYQQALTDITRNQENWAAFLRSACRNYKCPFHEQLMIHAQRPEATAVLEMQGWNKHYGRWVNRGATGIGVFTQRQNGQTAIKYYFDIADTHESKRARPVHLWEMRPEYHAKVMESLENSFGALETKESLPQALFLTANIVVKDNMPDYLAQLMDSRSDSFLEELDDLNVEVIFHDTLQSSAAYMLRV